MESFVALDEDKSKSRSSDLPYQQHDQSIQILETNEAREARLRASYLKAIQLYANKQLSDAIREFRSIRSEIAPNQPLCDNSYSQWPILSFDDDSDNVLSSSGPSNHNISTSHSAQKRKSNSTGTSAKKQRYYDPNISEQSLLPWIPQMRFAVNKNLAELYQAQDDFYSSLHFFAQALQDDMGDVVVWKRMGDAALHLGLFHFARQAYEGGLAVSPKNWICFQRLKALCLSIGDLSFVQNDDLSSSLLQQASRLIESRSEISSGMNNAFTTSQLISTTAAATSTEKNNVQKLTIPQAKWDVLIDVVLEHIKSRSQTKSSPHITLKKFVIHISDRHYEDVMFIPETLNQTANQKKIKAEKRDLVCRVNHTQNENGSIYKNVLLKFRRYKCQSDSSEMIHTQRDKGQYAENDNRMENGSLLDDEDHTLMKAVVQVGSPPSNNGASIVQQKEADVKAIRRHETEKPNDRNVECKIGVVFPSSQPQNKLLTQAGENLISSETENTEKRDTEVLELETAGSVAITGPETDDVQWSKENSSRRSSRIRQAEKEKILTKESINNNEKEDELDIQSALSEFLPAFNIKFACEDLVGKEVSSVSSELFPISSYGTDDGNEKISVEKFVDDLQDITSPHVLLYNIFNSLLTDSSWSPTYSMNIWKIWNAIKTSILGVFDIRANALSLAEALIPHTQAYFYVNIAQSISHDDMYSDFKLRTKEAQDILNQFVPFQQSNGIHENSLRMQLRYFWAQGQVYILRSLPSQAVLSFQKALSSLEILSKTMAQGSTIWLGGLREPIQLSQAINFLKCYLAKMRGLLKEEQIRKNFQSANYEDVIKDLEYLIHPDENGLMRVDVIRMQMDSFRALSFSYEKVKNLPGALLCKAVEIHCIFMNFESEVPTSSFTMIRSLIKPLRKLVARIKELMLLETPESIGNFCSWEFRDIILFAAFQISVIVPILEDVVCGRDFEKLKQARELTIDKGELAKVLLAFCRSFWFVLSITNFLNIESASSKLVALTKLCLKRLIYRGCCSRTGSSGTLIRLYGNSLKKRIEELELQNDKKSTSKPEDSPGDVDVLDKSNSDESLESDALRETDDIEHLKGELAQCYLCLHDFGLGPVEYTWLSSQCTTTTGETPDTEISLDEILDIFGFFKPEIYDSAARPTTTKEFKRTRDLLSRLVKHIKKEELGFLNETMSSLKDALIIGSIHKFALQPGPLLMSQPHKSRCLHELYLIYCKSMWKNVESTYKRRKEVERRASAEVPYSELIDLSKCLEKSLCLRPWHLPSWLLYGRVLRDAYILTLDLKEIYPSTHKRDCSSLLNNACACFLIIEQLVSKQSNVLDVLTNSEEVWKSLYDIDISCLDDGQEWFSLEKIRSFSEDDTDMMSILPTIWQAVALFERSLVEKIKGKHFNKIEMIQSGDGSNLRYYEMSLSLMIEYEKLIALIEAKLGKKANEFMRFNWIRPFMKGKLIAKLNRGVVDISPHLCSLEEFEKAREQYLAEFKDNQRFSGYYEAETLYRLNTSRLKLLLLNRKYQNSNKIVLSSLNKIFDNDSKSLECCGQELLSHMKACNIKENQEFGEYYYKSKYIASRILSEIFNDKKAAIEEISCFFRKEITVTGHLFRLWNYHFTDGGSGPVLYPVTKFYEWSRKLLLQLVKLLFETQDVSACWALFQRSKKHLTIDNIDEKTFIAIMHYTIKAIDVCVDHPSEEWTPRNILRRSWTMLCESFDHRFRNAFYRSAIQECRQDAVQLLMHAFLQYSVHRNFASVGSDEGLLDKAHAFCVERWGGVAMDEIRSLNVKEITVEELRDLIHNSSDEIEKNFQIIDLRKEEDAVCFQIPGSILIPFASILQGPGMEKVEELVNLKKRLIFYCNSGKVGKKALVYLHKKGIEGANLRDGIGSWLAKT